MLKTMGHMVMMTAMTFIGVLLAPATAQKCADLAQGDGKVNIEDLLVVLGQFGTTCEQKNCSAVSQINGTKCDQVGCFDLMAPKWTNFGRVVNPLRQKLNRTGFLGTHTWYADKDNWGRDFHQTCNLIAKMPVPIATGARLFINIYDPVDRKLLDVVSETSAWSFCKGLQYADHDYGHAESKKLGVWICAASAEVGTHCEIVNLISWGQGKLLKTVANPLKKTSALGTNMNYYTNMLVQKSYAHLYCGHYGFGGDSTSAISFVVGGGRDAHMTLCASYLGCYHNKNCKARNEAGLRVAIDFKVSV